jgi:CRISPR/Cas system endoribonuclease Cas6 (RAMP superfamily)
MKSNYVKPIIHYWKQGKIESAMYTLSQADSTVAHDCISAILRNSTFKMGIAPDVACGLVRKLTEIMGSKHSTYVKNSMGNLNEIVLMFK